MKQIILFAFVFLLFNANAQNWKTSGISVSKTGNKLTVKWSTENGVKTKIATCSNERDELFSKQYLCECADKSWFGLEIEKFNNLMSIAYFDELDANIWTKQNVPVKD